MLRTCCYERPGRKLGRLERIFITAKTMFDSIIWTLFGHRSHKYPLPFKIRPFLETKTRATSGGTFFIKKSMLERIF